MDGPPPTPRQLIVEAIEPDARTFGLWRAARGEPAIPRRFTWRGQNYEIARVKRSWKTTDARHRAVGDAYVRRHWHDILTTEGEQMRLYADRGSARQGRWWLHSRIL